MVEDCFYGPGIDILYSRLIEGSRKHILKKMCWERTLFCDCCFFPLWIIFHIDQIETWTTSLLHDFNGQGDLILCFTKVYLFLPPFLCWHYYVHSCIRNCDFSSPCQKKYTFNGFVWITRSHVNKLSKSTLFVLHILQEVQHFVTSKHSLTVPNFCKGYCSFKHFKMRFR